MSTEVCVHTLEELIKLFADKDGVVEIITRNGKKRYKEFFKVTFQELAKSENSEGKQLLENIAEQLRNMQQGQGVFQEKNLKQFAKIARLQNAELLLNGLNLCATAVGFAIVCAKLDQMSQELSEQISRVQQTFKQDADLISQEKFTRVLNLHTDMLDCRKKKQPYSEKELRELVDEEHVVLKRFINVLEKNLTDDNQAIITAVFSLFSMLAASIRYFDELYYFTYRDTLGKEGAWHSSRNNWLSVFSVMDEKWFVKKVQDYVFLETGLSTQAADYCFSELIGEADDMRQSIEDNRKIISALDDEKLLRQYETLTAQDVEQQVRSAVQDICSKLPESAAAAVEKSFLRGMALA